MNYRIVWSGERFTVWKKRDIGVGIKATLPLGTNFGPSRIPNCTEVSDFLSRKAVGDIVYTAYRDPVYLGDFAKGDLPAQWIPMSPYTVIELNSFLAVHLVQTRLSAGTHVLSVIIDSPTLMPGTDSPSALGPIFISTQFAGDVRIQRVSNSELGQLCERNLDWIAIAGRK